MPVSFSLLMVPGEKIIPDFDSDIKEGSGMIWIRQAGFVEMLEPPQEISDE
jgi:hypothetical protein